MKMLVVLPVRLNSSRLPQKPLQLILGKPLLQRMVEEVLAMDLGAQHMVVAADSAEICVAVESWNGCGGMDVVLVDAPCRNGTERVARLFAQCPQYRDVDVVVNIQADQLLLPREAVLDAAAMVMDKGYPIGTVAVPQVICYDPYPMPHAVEVLVDVAGRCLGFWRVEAWNDEVVWAAPFVKVGRHVGVYAYSPEALRQWSRLSPTHEEMQFGLEQLRPLQAGVPIGAAWLHYAPPITIDTPADLQWLRQWAIKHLS
ncbi:hypothetical protein LCGC14_2442660 [marine sediment metagenome]|uniref:3-deoxy-manno-octulosonate cytidylyltransferase n=1 Tax=marine sediment metagenome TaxID=412755 RepID=A0A0F9DVK3_9ZZZZ